MSNISGWAWSILHQVRLDGNTGKLCNYKRTVAACSKTWNQKILLKFWWYEFCERMNIYFVQGILVKTDKQNKLFEEFYRKQKICEDHEFNTFLDVCRLVSWVCHDRGTYFYKIPPPRAGYLKSEGGGELAASPNSGQEVSWNHKSRGKGRNNLFRNYITFA